MTAPVADLDATTRTARPRLLAGLVTLSLGLGVAAAASGSLRTGALTGTGPAAVAAARQTEPALAPAAYAARAATAGSTSSSRSAASADTARQSGAATSSKAGSRPAAAARPAMRVLTPLVAPAWAQLPPFSAILVPHSKHRLRVYDHPGGQKLIDLSNPLLPGLPLILAQYGASTPGWFPAVLPVRPNNVIGWVKASDVTRKPNAWRIEIYKSRHTLLLFNGTTLVGSFPVAVGKPSTPTPNGVFYIQQIQPSWGDFGPDLMPTSGFSNVYQTFGDGDAAVAIHGTNVDSSVGHSVSHGCIRMHNADAYLLAHTIKPGTLVRIHA